MPLLQRLALAALPAALLGLAACDRGPATVTLYMHPTGSFDFLIAATRNEGPLYMEIDGDPFATGEDLAGPIGAPMAQAVQTRVLQTGRAHVRSPVTNAPLVRRLLLEK